jgi:hypothetical protein
VRICGRKRFSSAFLCGSPSGCPGSFWSFWIGLRGSAVAAADWLQRFSPLLFASEQMDLGNEHQVQPGIFWSIRKPFSINDLEVTRFGIKSAF